VICNDWTGGTTASTLTAAEANLSVGYAPTFKLRACTLISNLRTIIKKYGIQKKNSDDDQGRITEFGNQRWQRTKERMFTTRQRLNCQDLHWAPELQIPPQMAPQARAYRFLCFQLPAHPARVQQKSGIKARAQRVLADEISQKSAL